MARADGLVGITRAEEASGVGVRGATSGLRCTSASPRPMDSSGKPRGSWWTAAFLDEPCWRRLCAGGELPLLG